MSHSVAQIAQGQWADELRPAVCRAIGRHRKLAQERDDAELVALLNLLEEFVGHVEPDAPVSHEDVIERRMLREQAWLLQVNSPLSPRGIQ